METLITVVFIFAILTFAIVVRMIETPITKVNEVKNTQADNHIANSVSSNSSSQKSNNDKPNLELLDKTTKYENHTMYIIGHIRNNSPISYKSVTVNIDLYDKNGNRCGDAIDIINNLKSGDTWEFKTMSTVDFQKYSIADIHGY